MRAIARVLEVSRSNLIEKLQAKSKKPKTYNKDIKIVESIKEIVSNRPSYGYRRVNVFLNAKLSNKINHKRVYRLMKEEKLLLTKAPKKPTRTHDGTIVVPIRNTRWCSDAFTIQCENGDAVNVVFSVDACDREVMRYIATTGGISAEIVRDLMLETVEYRFGQCNVPVRVQWLSDNGKCYTARETIAFGRKLGLEIRTTPAYSPESNGIAEALVKTFKRDYVWFGDLSSAEKVMKQLPNWFEDYNNCAPYKGLKMRSPREYIKTLKLAS